jgi:hypothetical protein
MATITWKSPVNGDWSDAADWSTDTVPTSEDDVTISTFGLYTVTISNNAFANSLTFNASATQLVENAGSLSLAEGLNVPAGMVSLNAANAIGGVSVGANGAVEFGNSGAMGSGTVSLTNGELLGTANETLTNALSISGISAIGAEGGRRWTKTRPPTPSTAT